MVDYDSINENSWKVAAVTWLVGDTLTTYYGLKQQGVVEENPTGEAVLSGAGTLGMVATKSAVMASFVGLQEVVPEPHDTGVPLGLAVLGTGVVANNLYVIKKASDA